MSEEGLARARRTLATVFLTDPRAASVLAQARVAGPPDRTTLKGNQPPARSRSRSGSR
jgi:hypothetical protein